jgi:pimeloyl-ACP methyl ester carboxylesterase
MNTTSAMRDFDNDSEITIPALRRIAVPTLVMYGEYSHCLPTCWALKKLIPDSHVMLVPDAGHFHPAVKPRRFVGTLLAFLQQTARMELQHVHSADRQTERLTRAHFLRRLYN